MTTKLISLCAACAVFLALPFADAGAVISDNTPVAVVEASENTWAPFYCTVTDVNYSTANWIVAGRYRRLALVSNNSIPGFTIQLLPIEQVGNERTYGIKILATEAINGSSLQCVAGCHNACAHGERVPSYGSLLHVVPEPIIITPTEATPTEEDVDLPATEALADTQGTVQSDVLIGDDVTSTPTAATTSSTSKLTANAYTLLFCTLLFLRTCALGLT